MQQEALCSRCASAKHKDTERLEPNNIGVPQRWSSELLIEIKARHVSATRGRAATTPSAKARERLHDGVLQADHERVAPVRD